MAATPTRRVVYQVASSLDGFIATEDGGYDWIPNDPDVDMAAVVARIDPLVMGRLTYEVMLAQEGGVTEAGIIGRPAVVFSRTLDPAAHPHVTVTADDPAAVVARLKQEPGGDIWLFGGGSLFRQLVDAGQVDVVEIAVIPMLLGSGIPLLPKGARVPLVLRSQRLFDRVGTVMLEYDVVRPERIDGL
jgi:dihydrofolate reductase